MNSLETVLEQHPPLYISAGVVKEHAAIVEASKDPAVAAIVMGAYTEPEWAGNDQGGKLNVTHWDADKKAFYNSIGLKNPGREKASKYLPESIKYVKGSGQLAVVQVTTLAGEDPVKVLPSLVEWGFSMGADRVEVNGSCPNVSPEHPLLCNDTYQTYAVFDAIADRVGQDAEVGFKVSPLSSHLISLYRKEGLLKVTYIDTINTLGNQLSPTNPATGKPFIEANYGHAGMSGPIIHDLAIDNLEMWTEPQEGAREFEIWSVGGVLDRDDVELRLGLGATMVGMAQEPYRASKTTAPFQRVA